MDKTAFDLTAQHVIAILIGKIFGPDGKVLNKLNFYDFLTVFLRNFQFEGAYSLFYIPSITLAKFLKHTPNLTIQMFQQQVKYELDQVFIKHQEASK